VTVDGDNVQAWLRGLEETLGVVTLASSWGHIEMQMQVGSRIPSYVGLPSGSTCVVLAESAVRTASALRWVAARNSEPLVSETNISYLRTQTSGTLTAVARLLLNENDREVWSVGIRDEAGRDVAIARSTVLIGVAKGD